MTTRIKLRRDTAANWTAENPILAAGEPGLETDTGKIKYGDGVTAWADLEHAGGDTLTDDGSVVVTAGNTEHWIATQRRDGFDTQPRGLRYDSQGNLYALTKTNEAQDSITVITKYTAAGAVAWQKSFTQVDPNSLAIDSSDRAYITVSDGDPEITVIKFGTTGDILWKKSYDIGPLPVYSAFIEEKSATTLALVAQAADGGGPPQSVLVLEISGTDGSVLLKKTLELESLQFTVVTGIDVDGDENVFVTGYYYDVEPNIDKMFIEKLDQDLNRVWSKTLEAPDGYNMGGGDCASDAQGNIYAVGSYEVKTVNAEDGTVTKSAAILTKLNSSGVVQWTRRIGPGPCGGFIVGLTATDVGDVYLSSTTYENKTDGNFLEATEVIQEQYRSSKQIVARYNTLGAVIWQRYVDVVNLNEEPSDFDRGQAVAVFGNKFAVDGYGFSTNNAGGAESSETADDERDYFVVQLPTDGTELTIGNLSFTESRVPGRFVTHEAVNSSLIVADYSETILAEDSLVTADADARIANNIVKSETYSYTFGADGTLTIPNDGDIKLTQSQVGYLMAIGTSLNNNDNIVGRATAVDTQGYLYVGGQDGDTSQPFVTKISPTGDRMWGVIIQQDGNGDNGRVNALSMNPDSGNLMVLAEMYGEYTYTILVTLDQDTGRILDHQKFSDSNDDVRLLDMAWTSTDTYVLGGEKNGDFSAELPVTPQTGSTTGVIRVLRNALPAAPTTSWQIGGTDISPFENIAYIDRYTGLTGTTRTGTGAEFTIDKTESSSSLVDTSLGSITVGTTSVDLGIIIDYFGFAPAIEPVSAYGSVSGSILARVSVNRVSGSTNYTTIVRLTPGTYSGFTVASDGTINGDTVTSQSFTVGGVTASLPPEDNGDGTYSYRVGPSTDLFNLESRVGETLAVTANVSITTPGSYSVLVTSGGTNYLAGHKIKVLGSALGGVDSTNDCIITVESVSEGGVISTVSNTGTPAAAGSTTYNLTGGVDYPNTAGSEGLVAMQAPSSVSFQRYSGWTNTAAATATQNLPTGTEVTFTSGANTYVGTIGTRTSQELVTDPTYSSYTITWTSGPGAGIEFVPDSVSFAVSGPTQFTGLSGTAHNTGSGFTMTFEPARDSNNYSNYWGYTVTAGGSNYVENDIIVISGTSLGGTSPANDLTVRVNVNNGAVQLAHEFTGTGQTTIWKLDTTTQVDFGGTGSWSLTYPMSMEGLLVTPTWQRTFNTNVDYDDRIYAVAVDSSDNIIAVGQGYGELNTGNFRDLALVFQFNSSGALQWVRQLNEAGDHCRAQSVITIGTDIYAVHDSSDDGDTVITKLDTTGTVKWQRKTQGGDDACIARTANGNLMVVAEQYHSEIDDDAIKVFQLTASGETVYKRWLSATSNDDTWLATPRGLCTDGHSFYIGGYFDTDNYDSALVVRLPIDGSGTGEYGSFSYQDVNSETSNFLSTGITNVNYSINTIDTSIGYTGAPEVAPTVGTATAVTTGTGTFYVDSWYPDLTIETIHDTDGGSIVFADGSKQTTSATDIPQRRYFGQRYMLGLKDRGHHILCDVANDSIIIPYNSRVPFPVGSVITVVNTTSSTIGIGPEGGSISVMLAGEGNNSWYAIQNYGMVTLLKIGPEQWVISGNVIPN